MRTPRVRKAEDFRVGVRYSRADLRLDRRDGMMLIGAVEMCCVLTYRSFAGSIPIQSHDCFIFIDVTEIDEVRSFGF